MSARLLLRVLCALCGSILFAGIPLDARLNLPQRARTVRLPEAMLPAVQGYFARAALPAQPGSLPPVLEQLLLESLPRDLRGACPQFVDNWGAVAKGSAEWRIRLLAQQPGVVWLAFRCGSRWPDYRHYYDERLAVLHPQVGLLEFFAHGQEAENDFDLYRIEFSERLALAGGAEAVVFRVTQSTDNPCCDGPTASRQERLVFYVAAPQGIAEALSLLVLKEDFDHDDETGDTVRVYQAEASPVHDAKGRVIGFRSGFRETVNGELRRSGTLRYRWNPTTLRFEEVP